MSESIIDGLRRRLRERDKAKRDDLQRRLREHAEVLAVALLGEPNRSASTRHELRFGRKGALALALTGEKRGMWFDHSSGDGGDLLALIQRENKLNFLPAVRWALNWLGDPDRHQPPPRRPDPEPDPEPRQFDTLSPWGRVLWAGAREIPPDGKRR